MPKSVKRQRSRHLFDLESYGRISNDISATRFANIDVLARATIETGFDDDVLFLNKTIEVILIAASAVSSFVLFGKIKATFGVVQKVFEFILRLLGLSELEIVWLALGGRQYVIGVFEVGLAAVIEVIPQLGTVEVLLRAVIALNVNFLSDLSNAIIRQRQDIQNEKK